MTNTQHIQKLSGEIRQLKQELQSIHQPADLRSLWLNGVEVSHALNMSAKTLQRLRKCGALPFSKIHGKIFYKRTDVEQLLENNYHKIDIYCSCR